MTNTPDTPAQLGDLIGHGSLTIGVLVVRQAGLNWRPTAVLHILAP